MLSAAKHLGQGNEILRFAQDDKRVVRIARGGSNQADKRVVRIARGGSNQGDKRRE
jgi:hypothetical protein